MVLLPAVAEMTPPPQEPVTVLGVATRRPGGRVSVKAEPVQGDRVVRIVDRKGKRRRIADRDGHSAERLADARWRNHGEGGRTLTARAALHRSDIRRSVGPDSRGRSGNGHAVGTRPERGQ